MNSLCRFYAAEKVLHLFNQKQPAAALKRSDHKTLLQNISSQQHTYHARLKGLEAVIADCRAVRIAQHMQLFITPCRSAITCTL